MRVPLEALFGAPLSSEDEQVTRNVEQMRSELSCRAVRAQTYWDDFGLRDTTSKGLTTNSSVGKDWGTFLYLCAKSIGAKTILELGTGAGFSGSYLASARSCQRFITIDASPTLTELARGHLARVTDKAVVISALADNVLDQLLPSMTGSLDLVYQDALKNRDPVLACVERLKPALSDGALMIFDDIRWSRGLWDAWQATRRMPEVSVSIDAGRFGLCFFEKAPPLAPKHFDFSWYTGWVRIQHGEGDIANLFGNEK
jgi:predicted O-methyltransferase YrrM